MAPSIFLTGESQTKTSVHDAGDPSLSANGYLILALEGTDSDSPKGYYRDMSTQMQVDVTLSNGKCFEDVTFSVGDIDQNFAEFDAGDADLLEGEFNNYNQRMSYIDRVRILSGAGTNTYSMSGSNVNVVGDIATSNFTDANGNNYPDFIEDNRTASDDPVGYFVISNNTVPLSSLSWVYDDPGYGVEGDPDGIHDFDSGNQLHTLNTGITFKQNTYQMCEAGTITLTACGTLSNIIWYNSSDVQVGTGTTLAITATTNGMADGADQYYYAGENAGGCTEKACPVNIEIYGLATTGITLETCHDNNTGNVTNDDYITFSLNPTGLNKGATYQVTADNGGTVTLLGGGAATGISYGVPTALRLQNGSADGTTTFTITVTDITHAACPITTTVSQNNCSVSLPCQLELSYTQSTCTETSPGVFEATLDVSIVYINAPNPAENIILNIDGTSQNITTLAGASNTAIVQLTIAADGKAHQLFAHFATDTACGDTLNFKAPTPCISDVTLNCNNKISGTAFQDFNYDGTSNDNGGGIAGIKVLAYDCDNNLVDSTYTDKDGEYVLTNTIAATAYRIEFDLPETIACWAKPTQAGTNNLATVQFAQTGTCVNLGVASPSDYCQSNPYVFTPCYIAGNPYSGNAFYSSLDAFVGFPYNSNNNTKAGLVPMVKPIDIGATWGVAYQRATNATFTSAVLKRHAGLGAISGTTPTTGGIYALDVANVASPTTIKWIDVNTIGINTGTNPRDGSAANSLANSPTAPSFDAAAFDQIGKIGIGDIDLQDDETLWLINLNDRSLYGIKNVNPNRTPTAADVLGPFALPNTGCGSGEADVRPWALEIYQGKVYIGAVCSGESSQNDADIHAYIFEFDPISQTMQPFFDFDLNYNRGRAGVGNPPVDVGDWQTWQLAANYPAGLRYNQQPILADIEFDLDGSMIIGMMDRWGLQVHDKNYLPDATASNTSLQDFFIALGDVLRVCNNNGTYVFEGGAGCAYPTTNSNITASEYYQGDYGEDGVFLKETAFGSLLYLPGDDEVMITQFDPFLAFNEGGIRTLNNTTGALNRRFLIYDDASIGDGAKAVGLGDIVAQCDLAPIEIGNYVWNDEDNDGIQNACEIGIDDVTIRLYDNNCNLIGLTISASGGQYAFNQNNVDTTGISNSGVPTTAFSGLSPNATYYVVLGTEGQWNTTDNNMVIDGKGFGLTLSNQGSKDEIDSDATVGTACGLSNAAPIIQVITDGSGCMNHSLDFGLFGAKLALGNYVWEDINNNGRPDAGETGIGNVKISLYQDTNMDGEPDGLAIKVDTTNADGYYLFAPLDTGKYLVGVDAMNFTAGQPLEVMISSYITELTDNTNYDTTDNGRNAFFTPTTNLDVLSGTIDLKLGTEPLNETIGTKGNGGSTDENNNLSIDFGFFVDCDGDGVSDNVEQFGDKDGDGISDACDYDPAGYIYCQTSGELVTGGVISLVSAPAGGMLNIIHDGSNGYYQFFTNGIAGVYEFEFLPPSGYVVSPNRSVEIGNGTANALDPTPGSVDNLSGDDPLILGTGDINGGDTEVNDFSAGSNPFYFKVDLAFGDPFIFNNNIPVKCPCEVNLSYFSDCVDNGNNNYTADLNLIIAWENYPVGDLLEVSFDGGGTQIIDPSTSTSPDTITYNTVADGSAGHTFMAHFQTETTCADTLNFKVPLPCPTPLGIDAGTVCSGAGLNANQIGGTVFEDWNYDGLMNEIDIIGVQGIKVYAYGCDGLLADSTYTDSNGTYRFNNLNETAYRIEFDLPAAVSCWAKPSQAGTDNGTTVQFAQPGTCVNLGLSNPATYCEDNPQLFTPCYINGAALDPTAPIDAMVKWSYNNSGNGAEDKTIIANKEHIGATWGVAYSKNTESIYASAILKRHVGLLDNDSDGNGDLGAIYEIDPNLGTPNGNLWLDVTDLGINVGIIGNDATRGLSDPFTESNDSTAYDQVGKVGLGDIDISDDYSTLYVMNLFDQTLYAIDIASKTLVDSYPIPAPDCSNYTPGHLRIHSGSETSFTDGNGDLWYADVSYRSLGKFTNTNTITNTNTGGTGDEALYQQYGRTYGSSIGPSYVLPIANGSYTVKLHYAEPTFTAAGSRTFDVAIEGSTVETDFDIFATAGATNQALVMTYTAQVVSDGELNIVFTDVIDKAVVCAVEVIDEAGMGSSTIAGNYRPFAVKYKNEKVYVGVICDAQASQNEDQMSATVYELDGGLFTEVLSFPLNYTKGNVYWHNGQSKGWHPWTSNIMGTRDGNNIFTYQQPILADIEFDGEGYMILGFIDRFGLQIGNDNYGLTGTSTASGESAGDILIAAPMGSTYTIESNAVAGTRTGANANNNEGINGGEFFDDNIRSNHHDQVHGGLALIPGNTEVVTTGYATVGDFDSGILFFSTIDGEITNRFQIVTQTATALFAKGTGLGDLELLCEPAPLEIGNYVWIDKNANGLQDACESALDSIQVRLYDVNCNLVGLDITLNNGQYAFNQNNVDTTGVSVAGVPTTGFSGLMVNSTYYVVLGEDGQWNNTDNKLIIGEDFYKLTLANQGSNDKIDSDATVGTVCGLPNAAPFIEVQTTTAGCMIHNADFGLLAGLSLGNLVWEDLNNNGMVDAGESGIDSVELQLFSVGPNGVKDAIGGDDVLIDSTLSDISGAYVFNDLDSGTYYVKIVGGIPTNMVSSTGTGTDGSGTATFEPFTGTNNDVDNDDDGTQMLMADGTLMIMSDTIVLREQMEPIDDDDTNANSNLSVDFGLIRLLSLGNLVWEDENNDGLNNNGETGIDGIEVLLAQAGLDNTKETSDDVILDSMLTENGGQYLFDSLYPGDYYLKLNEGIPAGMHSSTGEGTGIFTGNGSTEPANDPDATDTNDDDNGTQMGTMVMSDLVTLSLSDEPTNDGDVDTTSNLAVDFGLYQTLAVGNLVWEDLDNDGQFDNGTESGIEEVELILYSLGPDGQKDGGDDVEIARDTTKADGSYQFMYLAEATYYIKINSGIPTGYVSATGTGVDGTGTSTFEPFIGTDLNVDNDDDGTQMGTMVMSDTFQLVKNTEPINDADINNNTNTSIDFGLIPSMSLGNLVWEDLDNDGQAEMGESGIDGITVYLMDDGADNTKGNADDNILDSIITANGGQYLFDSLYPGEYYVKLNSGIPTGAISSTGEGMVILSSTGGPNEPAPDPDVNASNDDDNGTQMGAMIMSELIELIIYEEPINDGDSDSTSNLTVDFGLYKMVAIGDYTWEDVNGNGVQENNEPLLDSVKIILTGTNADNNPITDTLFTDSNGEYVFDSLPPGTYKLTFDATALGMVPTHVDEGSDAADNDVNVDNNSMTDPKTYVGNDTDTTIDGGFYTPAKIGDIVWEDTNGNGIQDETGTGVANVEVILLGTDGAGNPVADTTQTDGTGMYMFGDLKPGTYQVKIETPTGYVIIDSNEGTNDSLDSDIDENGITTTEILTSGENNPTYDMGIYQPAKIGDIVWEDTNGNGIQDETGTGVANVEVILIGTEGAGNPVADTTLTDNTGMYMFGDLAPGDYQVKIITPTGYEIIYSNEGTNDSLDSDIAENGLTAIETLVSNEENPTLDAGIYQPAKIGDLVWNDENANGIQDNNEAGIGNVEVILTGTDGAGNPVQDTTITDGTGMYMFGGLVPGDYTIKVVAPTDFMFTYPDEMSNDSLDSDANNQGELPIETLVSGENNPTFDAGLYLDASIGNLVWEDTNGNGIQDETGTGIPNVEVQITGMSGNGTGFTDTTFTDNTGMYYFNNLVPGTYHIDVVPPTGYEITHALEGTNDSLDSNIDEQGRMMMEVLAGNEMNPTYDAGLYQPAKIGNIIWEDNNADGIQNENNTELANVEVILVGNDGAGNPVADTLFTDNVGMYMFGDLRPGSYQIKVVAPTDFYHSLSGQGFNEAVDSDIDQTGISNIEVLISGETNLTYDAGLYQLGKLGDLVWNDENANGIQDGNEVGIGNVVVILSGTTGEGQSINDTTMTANNGMYMFSDLVPGTYTVGVEHPTGFIPSYNNEGTNDSLDSDINTLGVIANEILISNEENLTLDAGYYLDASIGNFVWEDLNANGIQDEPNTGISNVKVYIAGTTGNGTSFTDSTMTDGDGMYYFENLIPGMYYISIITPAGYFISEQNVGSDERFDSDIDQNGTMMMEVLVGNEMNPEYDAGLYQPAKIGNVIWEDLNGNGVQDEIGTGVANVQVILSGLDGASNTVKDTMYTDANGMYMFSDLVPGDYQINIVPPAGFELAVMDNSPNDSLDSDINQFGIMPMEALASGENNQTYDAGIYQFAKIGNFVWNDENANGIQDGTESGLVNVEVILSGTDGAGNTINDTVFTDNTGMYMFNDLVPGNYTISIVSPTDFMPTYTNEGTDDELDSDANSLGVLPTEALTSGETNLTYDAGVYLAAEIGNYVWEDINGNGVQDEANTGIANVEVQITGMTGNGTGFKDTTYTDGTGMYYFEDLVPGTYHIDVVVPTGYEITYQKEGTNDSLDSNIDEQGMMMMEVLVGNEMNPTYDAGLYQPAKIGDIVWEDTNGDGLQNEVGTGVANVAIYLTGTTGNGTTVLDTIYTDNTGMYMFGGLVPGDYTISVATPTGFTLITSNQGTNDTLDADANEQGVLPTETLTSGENNPTFDIGIYQPAKIGDFVWNDLNANGIQDGTEAGIENVEVIITGTDGLGNIVTDTTLTDGIGMYMFGGLVPGNYTIKVVAPTDFMFTYPDEMSNDSLDSDANNQGGITDRNFSKWRK